jgi:hypothetical protein
MLQIPIHSMICFWQNFINVLQKMGQWPSNGKKKKKIAFGKSCVACHLSLGRGDSPTFAIPLLSKFATSRL